MTESATPGEQVAHHLKRLVEASDAHIAAKRSRPTLRAKDVIERELVKAYKLDKKPPP